MNKARILYFAIADGRGHLMRAQLLRTLLSPSAIDVDIVTTSQAGADFVAHFGAPARVLPDAFELQFDGLHRLAEGASRRAMLRALSPRRAAKQAAQLEEWAAGAAFIVNDSLYPLLLLQAAWQRRSRVVQVVGENIHRTAWHRVHRERSPALRFAGQTLLRRSFERSFARVFHTLGEGSINGRTYVVPPLLAVPSRGAAEVRAEGGGRRIAAVYLNPHYRDVRIAEAVEHAVSGAGLLLHGVSEAFAARPGWRATDERFVDVANAADVLISGAGMAALEQARVLGVPLVALLGRQPEQEANVGERGVAAALKADSPTLAKELASCLRLMPQRAPGCAQVAQQISKQWVSIFEDLINAARMEDAHGEDGLAGAGNGEPQRRWRSAR